MESRFTKIAAVVLLWLIFLRILPFLLPESRTWGFNHLIFLPIGFSIAFFIIAAVAMILPMGRFSRTWGEVLAEWFSRTFYEDRLRNLYRLTFVAVLTALFIIFSMPTHFLGDGYDVIYNLASTTGIHVKWSEVGITNFMIAVQSLIGPQNEQNSRLAFQIVSIVSGAVTIWFVFQIAGVASSDKVRRLLIFWASLVSCTLLLFFGYAEYYPILWVFLSALVYFCLKYIGQGKGLFPAWLILVIGAVFHLKMVVFLPAVVYVTFAVGRGRELFTNYRLSMIIVIAAFAAAGLAGFIYKFVTDLYLQDMFLPPFIGKPIDPGYAIFSLSHLLDIFNEVMLISPLLILFFIFGIRNIKSVGKSRSLVFLLISSIGSILFLFLLDPKLGMPRDWDLFSFTAFTVSILMLLLIDSRSMLSIKRLLIPILLIMLISPVPFLAVNLNRDNSEEYTEYFMRLDFDKSLSMLVVMYGYYEEQGEKRKSDSLKHVYNADYVNKRLSKAALEALDAGDIEKASNYIAGIRKDKYDASYQRILARYNYFKGNKKQAMDHINKAIQLRPYYAELYWERGLIYLAQQQPRNSLKEFRKGYKLDSKCSVVLDGLAYIHYMLGNYDSSIYYGERLLALDSTRVTIYYSLALAYATNGDYTRADSLVEKFSEFVENDSGLTARYEQLIQMINNLKQRPR